MLSKFKLLFATLKHLKFSQLFYQITNRLKPNTYVKGGQLGRSMSLDCSLTFKTVLIQEKWLDKNNFSFLNLQHRFDSIIDWNFSEYGKLWNYNLEYFDYLNQADVTVEEKLRLINDFYSFSTKHKRPLEPYPVSLRSINLIRFAVANGIGKQDYHDFLYQELEYLDKNCEFHILGNHLLENAFALCLGGVFFSNTSWYSRAIKILRQELDEQILFDGAHFELSPMYHNVIFFRLLELIDWYSTYEKRNKEFLIFCREKASLMLDWLENIRFQNGDIPLFNDAAKGIAYEASFLINYAKQLDVERTNVPLGTSGYRSLGNEKYEVKVDLAQIGASYQPGHAHADALSFILYHEGKPLFVEQGTSTYNIGKRRDLERSTEAHNTVVVNGQNQSEVWGGFRVGKRAKTEILRDEHDKLEGSHNGYKKYGVIHSRSFDFFEGNIGIMDTLSDSCNGVFYLHVHPDFDVEQMGVNSFIVDKTVIVKFENCISSNVEGYEYAESYNKYQKGKRIVVDFSENLKTEISF